MFIYGASGHSKVIMDILYLQKVMIDGIFEDDPNKKELDGFPVKLFEPGFTEIGPIIIGVGDNMQRKQLAIKLKCRYGMAIHPRSTIAVRSEIGEGTVIMAGAIINPGTKIGKHSIVNSGAIIEHDCLLGDFVHLSPNSTLCGGVKIDEGSHIGAGAVVIPNITIGKWCTIGAGSVIIRDVPDFSTVVGNPGHIIRTDHKL